MSRSGDKSCYALAEDKVGVVKSCSPKSRTATIAWMERGKDNLLVPLLPGCPTETLPVYKLEASSGLPSRHKLAILDQLWRNPTFAACFKIC